MLTPQEKAGRLWMAAFEVACNLLDRGTYTSDAAALRALKVRAPGHAPAEYVDALNQARYLHVACVRIVGENAAILLSQVAALQRADLTPFLEPVQSECPNVPPAVCFSMLRWVLYWHHVRTSEAAKE